MLQRFENLSQSIVLRLNLGHCFDEVGVDSTDFILLYVTAKSSRPGVGVKKIQL